MEDRSEHAALERTQRSGLGLGLLFWLFMLAGLVGTLYARRAWWFPPLASREGADLDWLFDVTLWTTGLVFILIHVLLGYFVIRYRARPGARAHYFPFHLKLELTYTIIPAIAMVALSVAGLVLWLRITLASPADAHVVEVRGEQFAWTARYPGPDGQLGRTDLRVREPFNVDPTDPAAADDIVSPEILLVVDRPARVLLRTRDVQHSFFVPAFRMKKDLVPGATTEIVFTPTQTGTFDLACAELCGVGHYTMRGQVRVVTQEEFDRWMAEQARR
ncbi:MAG: cytochrome c oxidase subunit II [Armatimonadota bacterium]|nr:cytochrome c oxidase subunit II [Armatimonadota bacterium]MDR5697672.1 cytochrome c oxidase subunit II [Armatimonadota bacterium]